MSSKNKKYYWLKLDKNFFKSHDIEIVESMPNGKDYILFYLKLLCESVSHEGNLRFSDEIPYNEEMLSVITRTNIDIVRSAVKIFTGLKMMEKLDDGTIFMKQVQQMIGSETGWAELKRKQRALLVDNGGQCPIEKDKEKELDKDIITKENNIKEKKKFVKPTVEEIEKYCKERNNKIDANVFYDFYESKGWVVGKSSMKDWKACVRTWERSSIQNVTSKSKKEQKITLPDWYDQYTKELDERLEKEQQANKKEVEELGDDWFDVMKELFGEKNE